MQRPLKSDTAVELSQRELCYWLLKPECYLNFLNPAREQVAKAVARIPEPVLREVNVDGDLKSIKPGNFPAVDFPKHLDRGQFNDFLWQFAPAALLGRSWLLSFFHAGSCHTHLAAALFRVHRAYLDSSNHEIDVAAYRRLMGCRAVGLPKMTIQAHGALENIRDSAIDLALIRLCLARCASEYPGELIGFTIASVLGLSPVLDRSFARGVDLLDDYRSALIGAYREAVSGCQDAVGIYLGDSGFNGTETQKKARIATGIGLYVSTDRRFWNDLINQTLKKQSLTDQVLLLFRQKARYACGFHQSIAVGGRSLDDWFQDNLSDGRLFLRGLVKSEWFDAENPEQSLFFTQTVQPQGPMYGIFTGPELATILAWLRNYPSEEDCKTGTGNRAVRAPSETGRDLQSGAAAGPGTGRIGRKKPAEMFHCLVNCNRYPEILPLARNYVETCLRYSGWGQKLSRNPDLRPFAYSHKKFEVRIDGIYQRQLEAYRPLQGAPKLDRSSWIWVIRQFSPTILVDGCWLQNFRGPGTGQDAESTDLWRIFAEEIGDGDQHLNHPAIYRRLLESLAIELPEISDPEFAEIGHFVSGAFDLPNYLLAVSLFPGSFRPELLGVNLAIEISGLGAGYRRIVESLEYWGIDSTIARVHLSIDNMASGHSAIARRVVVRYLDQILAERGERTMQDHWNRIWRGFASVRVVPLRFLASMAWQYTMSRSGKGMRRATFDSGQR